MEREIVVSRNVKIGGRLDCHGQDRHVGAVDLVKASAVLELAHKTIALEALNGEFDGVRLPRRAEVSWILPEGRFTYFRTKITSCRWLGVD